MIFLLLKELCKLVWVVLYFWLKPGWELAPVMEAIWRIIRFTKTAIWRAILITPVCVAGIAVGAYFGMLKRDGSQTGAFFLETIVLLNCVCLWFGQKGQPMMIVG